MSLPNVALSIRQPWAWLIVNGHKPIENRDWPTKFRGPVLIHASLKIERDALADVSMGIHPVTGGVLGMNPTPEIDIKAQAGGIVGVAEIVDCVTDHPSPWFVGDYGFVLRDARPLPFMPLKGMLGFFKAEYILPSA